MVQKPQLSSSQATTPPSGLFAFPVVRGAILLAWLVCTVAAAGIAAVGFRIDNSVGVWFAEDDPALADYRRFLGDFGNREWVLVAVEQEVSSREAQAADWDELVSRYQEMEHVHWVMTSSDFREKSDFVRRFLKPDPQRSHEALLLHITNDIERQDGYREALVSELRNVAEALPTIASVQVAGTAVINGELNHAARRDMFLFFPAVALFVILIGFAVFRNIPDTFVLLSVSLGTVVVTEGILVGVGYPLNMVTIMLPTVLIALSVADVVHLIHAYHAAREHAGDSSTAASQAVKSILWPCAGTTLTTIAGFLAFSGSSVLPVFQLSVFVSFGIALAWLLTMTGGPALLVVLWHRSKREAPPAILFGRRILAPWSRFVGRHPWQIVGAFVLGSVVLLGLPSLQADTDYVKFFRSKSRVPRDYQSLQSAGFPQNPLNLVFQPPNGIAPTSSQYWGPLESFSRQLPMLPGVHSVLSPFVMADLARVRCEYAETLGGMLSQESDQVQLTVMMDYPSSQRLFRLLPAIRALADSVLPTDLRMIPTGTSYLWARMDDGVIRTQKESLAIVCVVCFVILVFLFRSVWLGVLGLVLSLLPGLRWASPSTTRSILSTHTWSRVVAAAIQNRHARRQSLE
jgi:predicted RND superfamily exporter protein